MSRCVPNAEWPGICKQFVRYSSKLFVEDGILIFKSKDKSIIVLPHEMLVVILLLHFKFAHEGRDKLQAMLLDVVWHPNKLRIIGDVCATCPSCQVNEHHSQMVALPMLKICSSYIFELVAANLLSLPKIKTGFIGCLVLVDYYSKWVSAVPIKNKLSVTVIQALNQALSCLLVVPSKLLTDNGPEFTSNQFESFLNSMGVEHQLTTPYHLSSNGAVERVNCAIQGFLRNLHAKADAWEESLPQALIS